MRHTKGNTVPISIENRIFSIRGFQVMIDRDLAELYGVEVKRLNEQVRRNIERFPDFFRFQLSNSERDELVAICDRLHSLKHSYVNLYAITEQGVAMLSAILRSDVAIKVSIQIMNAFVEMRRFMMNHSGLLQRVEKVESKLHLHDDNFEKLFTALESKQLSPKQNIFFDGQIYDAYQFVIQLIQEAERSILLIDNYIDQSVLSMLTKKQKGVNVTLVTTLNTSIKNIDLEKFNKQYPLINLKTNSAFHDRFLLLDSNKLYHIGASMKDLGKKCFAFSKMDDATLIRVLLEKIA